MIATMEVGLAVATTAPPHVSENEIISLPGGNVPCPVGYSEPTIFTKFTPATPEAGEVLTFS